MRYFLVIAILTLTGGVQAAQAGSLTAPTVRVSPSVHPSLTFNGPRVSATQAHSSGDGSVKTTSSLQWSGSGGAGDRGIIAVLRRR